MFWLVPSPASLNLTVSDPPEFTVPVALMKCALTASAAGAPMTSPASIIGSAEMKRIRRGIVDLPPKGIRNSDGGLEGRVSRNLCAHKRGGPRASGRQYRGRVRPAH